jgi:hypothetical protein
MPFGPPSSCSMIQDSKRHFHGSVTGKRRSMRCPAFAFEFIYETQPVLRA